MGCGASSKYETTNTTTEVDISLGKPVRPKSTPAIPEAPEGISETETAVSAPPEVDATQKEKTVSRKKVSWNNDEAPIHARAQRERKSTVDSLAAWSHPEQTLIFLDWDDTIFPTTELFDRWGISNNMNEWADEFAALSADRKRQLEQWSEAAYSYLDTARELSNNLVIVTNARDPWVPTCVKHFAPILSELLTPEAGGQLKAEDGGIRVVYTRDAAGGNNMIGANRSRDPKKIIAELTALKYRVFRREAWNFYKQYPEQTWKNILSIGDAIYEHDAVLQVAARRSSPKREKLRTKAFLLLSDPPIAKLTLGLTVGRYLLPMLVKWDGSLDLNIGILQDWDKAATASQDALFQKLFGKDTEDDDVGGEEFTAAERVLNRSHSGKLLDALWHRAISCKPRHSLAFAHNPFACSSTVVGEMDVDASIALQELTSTLGGEPSLVLVHTTSPQGLERIVPSLAGLTCAAIHGCTSYLGVMSGQNLYCGESACLFGIRDPAGCYVSAARQVEAGDGSMPWRLAATRAAQDALALAGMSSYEEDELPLILLHSTPGFEEAVLEGVEDILPGATVFGGSAAHMFFEPSQWRVAAGKQTFAHGAVTLALLWPSVPYSLSLNCVHEATTASRSAVVGRTTKNGRRIVELGGEPAAEVYKRWLQEEVGEVLDHGESDSQPTRPVMRGVGKQVSLHPLARMSMDDDLNKHYFPLHPSSRLYPDGSLGVYAKAIEGEELCLLKGTHSGLVEAMKRAAVGARQDILAGGGRLAGVLVTGCSGLAGELQRAGVLAGLPQEVFEKLRPEGPEGGKLPLHGFWANGEQGPLVDLHKTCHANLMLNFLVFYKSLEGKSEEDE
eukprot:TRINITY_DN104412_c0_g1_i1.p1 TRINITY_DN104412_c0_g1~~TRINITY_DN104412_c0_g1_i1.p1  ORF type:complete len:845 (+),score=130.34 TRINITY_DN104412_c0_g1_i1:49-2583(+)